MKIRFGLVASACAIALAGCASSNDVITANVNPKNGAPVYRAPPVPSVPQRSPLELRAEAVRNATDDELSKLLVWRTPESVIEDVKVQRVNLATKITVTSTPKHFFAPGVYSLQHTPRSKDRSGAVFMDQVSRSLRNAVERAKAEGGGELNVSFQATYFAEADSAPATGLRYRGEYGDVMLPSTITTANGKPMDIRITKGQQIDNAQLAALRAVSLASIMHGNLDPYKIADKFVLTVADARGLEHRWVKVEVTITPIP